MDKPTVSVGERVIAGAFGACFGGVGLTVMCLNLFASDGFGSPPLFFRVFAFFISLPFIAFGGAALYAAVTGKQPSAFKHARDKIGRHPGQDDRTNAATQADRSASAYICPHCGAPLGDRPDVSPSGDVKCEHCRTWFNIHRR